MKGIWVTDMIVAGKKLTSGEEQKRRIFLQNYSVKRFVHTIAATAPKSEAEKNIWIICQPSTGSTLLSNAISLIVGKDVFDLADLSSRMHVFDPLSYISMPHGAVFHVHSEPTNYLVNALRVEKTAPAILRRPIQEIVVSLANKQINRFPNLYSSKDECIKRTIIQWVLWLNNFDEKWKIFEENPKCIDVNYSCLITLD